MFVCLINRIFSSDLGDLCIKIKFIQLYTSAFTPIHEWIDLIKDFNWKNKKQEEQHRFSFLILDKHYFSNLKLKELLTFQITKVKIYENTSTPLFKECHCRTCYNTRLIIWLLTETRLTFCRLQAVSRRQKWFYIFIL